MQLGTGELGVAAVFLWEGAMVGLAGALAGLAGSLCVTVAVGIAPRCQHDDLCTDQSVDSLGSGCDVATVSQEWGQWHERQRS